MQSFGQTTKTDRNGNVHAYSYDILGRRTADAVTTLGAGVDGTVRRLETAYDSSGRPSLLTSFDAASGGNVLNQVLREYNGLGQVTAEYQSHSGTVNTSTTPAVHFTYSEMAGGANHSRSVGMTYPNGRELSINYASGLDNNVSRISSLSDGSVTLETYSYLGLSTIVKRTFPEAGTGLSYVKLSSESTGDAGDQYTGLDRFGRIVDQRWLDTTTAAATDRFVYGYDRDGNALYKANLVDAVFSELYHASGSGNGYDSLNQLTDFLRGELSSSSTGGPLDTVGDPARSQNWSLDALGNWSSVATDGTTQNRNHDSQNNITSVGSNTLTSDDNGNVTVDETGRQLIYDAWNRLVRVEQGETTIVAYTYDAYHRRITEDAGTTHDLYYSPTWDLLEVRDGSLVLSQYVWSASNHDTLIARDRDTDANGTLDERLYVQQDANFNVTAVVDTSGTVVERFIYDPYGNVGVLAPNWSTRSASTFDWVFLFQGSQLDLATGFYQMRFRDYSPTLGRFLQRDPLGYHDSSNSSLFVLSNPINHTDPMGLACNMFNYTGINIPFAYTSPAPLFMLGPIPVYGQMSASITGSLYVRQCPKCCPDGSKVNDEEAYLDFSSSGYIAAVLGYAFQFKWKDDIRVIGYLGLRFAGFISGSARGGGRSDKCRGINEMQLTVCAVLNVTIMVSGGGSANIRFGYANIQAAVEPFGSGGTTTSPICFTYSNAGGLQLQGGWPPSFGPWSWNIGIRVCPFGGCWTWSLLGTIIQPI